MSEGQTNTPVPVRAHTRARAKDPAKRRTSVRRQGVRLTKEQREVAQGIFLATFSRMANISAACREAGIDRDTFYTWQKDERFAARFEEADHEAQDMVRLAIYQRGINGWLEPVVSQGKIVRNDDGSPLMVRKFSDALTLALAKARLPEYRERVEVNATLDINTLASEADARFSAYLAAIAPAPVLGLPEPAAEGRAPLQVELLGA